LWLLFWYCKSMNWGKTKTATKGGLAAILVLATPVVAQYEGLRTKAYLDPIGIATICYGETHDVELGQVQTVENCKAMLSARLGSFAIAVDTMVKPEVKPEVLAAFSSLSYNIGIGAFQKSSVLRLANEGKLKEACDFMLKYNRAGGKVWEGLNKRRRTERLLCLQGL